MLDQTSLSSRIQAAEAVIRELLSHQTPLVVTFSGGKDSSVSTSLVLSAAKRLARQGRGLPPIVVTHGDTGVENPEVSVVAREALAGMQDFAERYGIPLEVGVARPNVAGSWAYRVIGRGCIPVFPGASRECTVEFKIRPQKKLAKAVFTRLSALAGEAPVTVIGTRFAESEGRRARMEARGETGDAVWQGEDGRAYFSPIADWSTDDVWEYLGACRAGTIEAFSDMEDVFRVYADAAGASCAVVADMALGQRSQGGCGARHGCWACTAVGRDASLETMIETDDRYDYLRGLNRLQRFLLATRYDWGRRAWLGRTIDDRGYVDIQPDLYSAGMVEELLQYCLTLDAEEAEAAERAGLAEPRFQIISPESLIAIDAEWSRQGYHRPFHALKLLRDIQDGARYPVPEIEPFPQTRIPDKRLLYVGEDWDEGVEWANAGLRDISLEMAGDSCIGTRTLPDGRQVQALETGSELSVDPEGAEFVLGLELDRLVDRYHDAPGLSMTYAYRHYLTLGTVQLHHSGLKQADAILRRTRFKEHHDLVGHVGEARLQALLEASLTPAEVEGMTQPGLDEDFEVGTTLDLEL